MEYNSVTDIVNNYDIWWGDNTTGGWSGGSTAVPWNPQQPYDNGIDIGPLPDDYLHQEKSLSGDEIKELINKQVKIQFWKMLKHIQKLEEEINELKKG